MFFFSSRRRHTRFDCDWSSDVCSSDLHVDVGSIVGTKARGLYIDSFIPPDRLEAAYVHENIARVRGAAACAIQAGAKIVRRSEEHTSELQSQSNLVCRLLLEKKKKKRK